MVFEKKLEIIPLSGDIKSAESYLYASVSDEIWRVFGGNLLPGKIVFKLFEVLIGVIPNLNKKLFGKPKHNTASLDIYVCPWSERDINLLESSHIKYNYYVLTNDEEF